VPINTADAATSMLQRTSC